MSIDFEQQRLMVEECVNSGKIQVLNELLMNSYDTVHQLRGAIYSHIEELEQGYVKDENSNKHEA